MKYTVTTTHRNRIERRLRSAVLAALATRAPEVINHINQFGESKITHAVKLAVDDLLLDFKVTPRK